MSACVACVWAVRHDDCRLVFPYTYTIYNRPHHRSHHKQKQHPNKTRVCVHSLLQQSVRHKCPHTTLI